MILFKLEHVAPILSGRKTQTRRTGNRRWNVGAVHQCRTRMLDPDSVFAKVRILDVHSERLVDISDEDVRAEGYETFQEFARVFGEINKVSPRERADLDVWVVRFEVVP